MLQHVFSIIREAVVKVRSLISPVIFISTGTGCFYRRASFREEACDESSSGSFLLCLRFFLRIRQLFFLVFKLSSVSEAHRSGFSVGEGTGFSGGDLSRSGGVGLVASVGIRCTAVGVAKFFLNEVLKLIFGFFSSSNGITDSDTI